MPETISSYEDLMQILLQKTEIANDPVLIGITGPPASGKSTLAQRLVGDLNLLGINACFCPMDGFHLTNEKLEELGLMDAKGRIDTFDADAFVNSVKRLRDRGPFWWPIYSRTRHDPILEGVNITGSETVFIIEGNYLLTNGEPWSSLGDQFDLSVFIDVSNDVIKQRLMERHKISGRSSEQAIKKINSTDMVNAEFIRQGKQFANILLGEAFHV
jgi:pantothenate kinase